MLMYYVLGLMYSYVETIAYTILVSLTRTVVFENQDDVASIFRSMNHSSTWASKWFVESTKARRPGLGLSWVPGAFVWISRTQSLTAYKYAYTITVHQYASWVPEGISCFVDECASYPVYNAQYYYHPTEGAVIRRTLFTRTQVGRESRFWQEECLEVVKKMCGNVIYVHGPSGIGKSCFADFLAKHFHHTTAKTVTVVRGFNLSVEGASLRDVLQDSEGMIVLVLDEIDKSVDYAMDPMKLPRNSLCNDKAALLNTMDTLISSSNVFVVCTGNSDPVIDIDDERYPFYNRMDHFAADSSYALRTE